jgi:hypothetical protein
LEKDVPSQDNLFSLLCWKKQERRVPPFYENLGAPQSEVRSVRALLAAERFLPDGIEDSDGRRRSA